MPAADASSLAPRGLRSAMFVDFDNVYSLLQRLDPDAAKAFAEAPARWIADLSSGIDGDGPYTRRFLVQKCYLNPAPYSRYRPNFTRAGFQVVDCPSLTQQGKSSADINLVLDAMDALASPTRFDEFVFLSADADFTPLVIRCRAADRLVTIVTPGPAAAAYRAVADTVLSADLFIGLLTSEPEVVPGAVADDGESAVHEGEGMPAVPAADPVAAVRQLVRAADRPVALSTAAALAQRAQPTLPPDWNGAGTFTAWLRRSAPDLGVTNRSPGFVWDPERFTEADLPSIAAAPEPTPEPTPTLPRPHLTELQNRVATLTETPGITAAGYRCLFAQLTFDLALHPFSRNETSKRVRDECANAGTPIGRGVINTVLTGLLIAGANLDGEPTDAQLAAIWAENVLGLCRGARIDLSPVEAAEVTAWVSGGLVTADES